MSESAPSAIASASQSQGESRNANGSEVVARVDWSAETANELDESWRPTSLDVSAGLGEAAASARPAGAAGSDAYYWGVEGQTPEIRR